MSSVAPANSTVAFIRTIVRELTASPGENQLTTAYLDQSLNNFYNSDFPYAIKLDQMRDVYTFYTQPYIDRYPLDVNYNQGVREPFYVDGIQGQFYKDRTQFFNVWPKFPTTFQPISGAGGAVATPFSFTITGPFLSGAIVLGGVAVGGNPITIADDGNGKLQLQVPNPVVSVPVQTTTPSVSGMYNRNTGNPGLYTVTNIGTVNYVTGVFSGTFPAGYIPAAGTTMTLRVSQYQTGRPFSLLFWNNEFTIRPVPKKIHQITVETYLTPVQFMLSTDSPILNQWAQYLGYGTAIEILRRRQDMAGVQNLMEGFKRQEQLVLERQATEEIGQRNQTVFSGSSQNNQGFWGAGWGGGYGY